MKTQNTGDDVKRSGWLLWSLIKRKEKGSYMALTFYQYKI